MTHTCPSCGNRLRQLGSTRSSDTAPFVCLVPCARAWWESELSAEARSLWNPVLRSHGPSQRGEEIRRGARRDLAVSVRRKQERGGG